jgi:ABC-2 type transport system ATP-binding protein
MSSDRTGTPEPVVRVDGLTQRYGRFPALRDLSLEIRRGELYALLGTNGAGKTTALECMEGHRAAGAGRILVLGSGPLDRRAIRPRIGMMLQETGFAPDLTVRETLLLAGRVSGRTDDARRVIDVIHLPGKGDVRVSQLSGGEKRRLDFGMAIWGSPELLFLDEPTTGLDPGARDDLWDAVAGLRADGATIVLTTHYLEEAQSHADRIGFLHQGELRREGTVAELVSGLASRIEFVAPPGVTLPLAVTSTLNGLSRIESTDVQRDMAVLLDWADRGGHRLERLSTTTSTLDDVFRALAHSHLPN